MSPRVEADFIIVDHASGTARDIRREMERLDRAALRAGASLDTVGSSSDVQRMENLDRSVQRMNRDVGQSNGLLGIFRSRILLMGGGVLAALPLVQQLGGAVVQLVGSLVQAAGGAGVIGGGALGAFAVGLGSVMVVARTVTTEVQNSYKAFTQYTTAVKEFGAASTQAATAHRNLNQAISQAPPGTMRLVQNVKSLSNAWDEATARARGYVIQTASYAANRARSFMGPLGNIVNQNVGAFASASRGVIDRLLSPDSMRILGQLSAAFRRDLPPAADALANLVMSFGRLAAAAAPFVRDFLDRFDRWTQRLDLSTRDTAYFRYQMSGLVTEFTHWLNLLLSAGRFLETLFQAATRTHTALGGITGSLDRWTQWMRDNPVRIQRFFNTTGQAMHDLWSLLGYVVKLLGEMSSGPLWNNVKNVIAQFAQPLSALLVQIVQLIVTLSGSLGPLGGTLSIAMRLLAGVLGLINSILHAIPGLGFVVAGALTALGIYKMVTAFGQFVGLIPRASGEMGGLTAQTNAAAAATERLAMAQRSAGGGVGVGGSMMGGLFPGRGRVGGFFGSRGAITPSVSAAGEPLAVLSGSSGIRGFFARRAAGSAGVGVAGAAEGELGMLGRAGGMLGRIGGVAGPLSLGLMLASSFAPQGGRLGGALTGASIGSLGMFLGPEVGLPAMGIGALIGALTAHGADPAQGYLQRQLQGYTHHVPTGAMSVAGRFGNISVPTFRDVHIASPLAALGGSNPHTSDQISGQLNFFHRVLANIAGDTNSAVVQERQQILQTVAALRQVLPGARQQERHAAFMGAGQLGQAFNIVAPQRGAAAGMQFVLQQAERQWGGLTTAGKVTLRSQILDWANEMRRSNPALTQQFEDIKNSVIGKFDAINGQVRFVNGHVLADVQSKWRSISKAMSDPVEQAREAVSRNMTSIQRQALGTLSAMGYTPADAQRIMLAVARGGTGQQLMTQITTHTGAYTPAAQTAHRHGYASGGRFAGSGLRDTVPLGGGDMAAPGELIVNRHTERHLDSMLAPYGVTAGGLVASENRPHHMYATGGRYHGFPMPHKNVRRVSDAILQAFPGLSVSSTVRPGGADYHTWGEAVDLAAPMTRSGMGLMNRAAAWAGSHFMRALVEGIHNPNLSIKEGSRVADSYWGASTWNAHRNHIHVAVLDTGHGSDLGPTGPRSGVAARSFRQQSRDAAGQRRAHHAYLTMQSLLTGSTTLPGMPGAIVDSTGLEVSAGTLGRLNSILGGAGGGGAVPGAAMPGGGVTGGGTSNSNQALARRMMLGMWGASQWPYLRLLWERESGFRTTAKNPSSGAYGIPQSLPADKMATAGRDYLTNPATQIQWGLGYISGRYGNPKNAWAHEQNVGWYGEGGDFIARRPQTIGVGDRPERVHITPLSQGAGAGRHGMNVTVHIGRIDATGKPGAIREMVRGEIRDAIADVADELDRSGNVEEAL